MGVYRNTVTYNVPISDFDTVEYYDLQVADGYDLDFVVTITADSSIDGAYATIEPFITIPSAVSELKIYSCEFRFEYKQEYSYGIPSYLRVATGDDDVRYLSFNRAGRYSLGTITMYDSYKNLSGTYSEPDPPYIKYEGDIILFTSPVCIEFSGFGIEADGIDVFTHDSHVGLQTDYIYEFPELHYPVSITAPTTYLGNDMRITAIRDSRHEYSITYTFGDLIGNVVGETYASSVVWDIPTEDFLAQFSETEVRKDGILTVRSIYRGEVFYTENVPFIILLDSTAGRPEISPTIVDTNSTTIALTGDENIIVKYYSNAYVDTGATAQGVASITSVKTVCGSKAFTGLTGTISGPDTNVFTITATDTRGLTSTYTETLSSTRFIDYSKLSCNLFVQPTTTDGELIFTLEGNCFNGSFGAVNNTLTLQYRYKTKDGSYGNWTTVSASVSSYHNYSKTVTLTGLNYQTIYTIQARAIDKLATVVTPELFSVGKPIFDWSKEDFNFNIPVTASDSLLFPVDEGIYGVDADGIDSPALIPFDSSGNTVIGYGNYTNESGSTLIYGGDSVDILTNGDITFNGKSFLGAVNALTNSYTFTGSVIPGNSYNTASCSLTLRGNCLYCRFYASRASASGTGDITDELMGTVTFNHGGKITGMDYVNGIAGTSGTTAAMTMKSPSVSGNTATFSMYLSNTAGPGSNFLASFVIPVSLNINNF